ncbi:hypothetical protein JL722_12237 [Aureococcus anophagefferens]|nr:hypothetical protein JL722_12237 [Aureococcus anophagefferens]
MQADDRSLWERSTARSYLRAYFRLELRMLWWFRSSATGRSLALPLRHVISQNPTRDVTALTWVAFVAGIFYSGYHFTLADRTRGAYGSPDLATHMAVVVFLQLSEKGVDDARGTDYEIFEGLIWGGSLALVALVALSRLVAGSRFVYQIDPWRDEWHNLANNAGHVVWLTIIWSCVAAYVAHYAEDNSSHFFSIPNDEFTRVMKGIYNQPGSRGYAPKRRNKRGQQYAPPDALSNLSARLSQRPRAAPGI